MNEKFTAYITKYALTSGILKAEDAQIIETSRAMIVTNVMGDAKYFHGDGREWHRTLAGAKERADLMRYKKIANLSKQIQKLEAIKF